MEDKRTLIIYQMFKETEVTDFFLDHGVTHDKNVDYVFVINTPDFKVEPFGFSPSEKFMNTCESISAKVLYRENKGTDFGGYSCVVDKYLKTGLLDSYDFFIFMNQTMIGPLLPHWSNNLFHWSSIFTNLINETDKLAGVTINCVIDREIEGKRVDSMGLELPLYSLTPEGKIYAPHVQTQLFVMDKVSLGLAVNAGIFDYENVVEDKGHIIVGKEVRLSEVMLQNNYNIASIQGYSQGIDFRMGNFNEAWDNPWGTIKKKVWRKTADDVGGMENIPFAGTLIESADQSREYFYKTVFMKSARGWGKESRRLNKNFISNFSKNERLGLTWSGHLGQSPRRKRGR